MIDRPFRGHPEATMRLLRWGAPVALAMVVAAVVGGAVWLSGGDGKGSSATPPLLRLSAASGGRDAAMSAADSTAPETSGAAYKLVGTLPDGTPADQPIYKLADATADDVTTVARALGMSGDAKRIDGGWTVRDNDNRLWVRDDGSWSYGPDCYPDGPVSDKGMEVGCAYAVSGGTAVAVEPPDASVSSDGSTGDGGGSDPNTGSGTGTEPAPDCPPDTKDCTVVDPAPEPLPAPEVSPGPSEAEARAAADKVFAALGLSDARVTVWPGDPTASVQASPRVHGLDTVGLGTYLQVDGDGAITWADGHLPGVVTGPAYPVISAQAAFDKLLDAPRPAMDICMVRKDGEPGCAEIPPAEVTGAALGLLLDYDADRPVLVPAWLFDVKDQPDPVAQIAIDPAFLAPPASDDGDPKPLPPGEPVPVEPMPADSAASSGGGSSSGDTGTVEPGVDVAK
jgi:hypothetical protein